MDFNEIKKIIESEGGKLIIIENGKPILVVASFEDYKRGLKETKRINSEDFKKSLPKELEEDLKIEDLPF